MTDQPDLSICMIVKNEEQHLQWCLESIKHIADEIIIVDTGSDDNTVSVAQSFGAHVIYSQWNNDFSSARNISLHHASGVWILWLDADDHIPSESVPLINTLKKSKPGRQVYAMVVRNQKPNGTGTEFAQARMFPNHSNIFFERPIHEQIMPSAFKQGFELVKTSVVIEHYGYATPQQMKEKAVRNVALLLNDCDSRAPDPVTYIEIADSFTIMENDTLAQQWYEKVIALPEIRNMFPAIASQAFMGLGNIHNRNKAFEKAVPCFVEAHALCPERSDVLYCLAVSEEMLGRKSRAAELLSRIFDMDNKALQIGVDYRQTEIKAYIRLARILARMKEYNRLEQLCRQALEKYGQRPELYTMAGIGFIHLNKLVDSIRFFEKSLHIRLEENLDPFIGLCIIYKKANKEELVFQTLEKIKPNFAKNPKYWAFCMITGFSPRCVPIPRDINANEIEEEKAHIEIIFGIEY